MVLGKLRENFSIKYHMRFFQIGYKRAICRVVGSGSGIDPDIPKRAEISLAAPAVAVLVRPRFHDRLFGGSRSGFSAPAVAFRVFQKALPLFCFNRSTFDSGHSEESEESQESGREILRTLLALRALLR